MAERGSARTATWVVAAVVALGLALGIAWLAWPDPAPHASPAVAKAAPVVRTPTPSSLAPATCATAAHDFVPRKIAVAGVTKGASVVTPPRDADGVPGAPPLTTRGKSVFAWDKQQGILPGDPAGNVLLNAHTWPDGSALGNRMLAKLHTGDRIVVIGASARLCYRVTERIEVPVKPGLLRYYATDGPPQLAIVVCSGRRLGPGEWTKRTVWFASPAV
jgi:hypothetical protein